MISDMIFKIVISGICVCIINIIIKKYQPTYVVIINLLFLVTVLLFIISNSSESFNSIRNTFTIDSASSKIIIILYKSAAVCILSKIGSDICREGGSKVIAEIIDMTGRLTLLFIAFPYIENIIKTTTAFVK